MNSHQFALYQNNLGTLLAGKKAGITTLIDRDLAHRIVRILRLTAGESVTLFNRTMIVDALLKEQLSSDKITIEITSIKAPIAIKPEITIVMPLLKKEALETALYELTAFGVNQIMLYSSTKTHAHTGFSSERLERIMIAAAEQSKQFFLPMLHAPKPLAELLNTIDYPLIFADPSGTPASDMLAQLHTKKPLSFTLMVGPEGDLTPTEKQMLHHHHAQFYRLTPTILRAEQALSVLVGIIRTFIT